MANANPSIKKKHNNMEITIDNLATLHREYNKTSRERYNFEAVKNRYNKEELILHELLSNEAFYCASCEKNGQRLTLQYVKYVYPDTTMKDVKKAFKKYFSIVNEIYG